MCTPGTVPRHRIPKKSYSGFGTWRSTADTTGFRCALGSLSWAMDVSTGQAMWQVVDCDLLGCGSWMSTFWGPSRTSRINCIPPFLDGIILLEGWAGAYDTRGCSCSHSRLILNCNESRQSCWTGRLQNWGFIRQSPPRLNPQALAPGNCRLAPLRCGSRCAKGPAAVQGELRHHVRVPQPEPNSMASTPHAGRAWCS